MKQIFLVLFAAFLMAFNLTAHAVFWGSGDTKAKTGQTQAGQKADDDDDDAKPVASGQAVETGTQAATTEESDDDDKEDD